MAGVGGVAGVPNWDELHARLAVGHTEDVGLCSRRGHRHHAMAARIEISRLIVVLLFSQIVFLMNRI